MKNTAQLIAALDFIAAALRDGEMTPAYAAARLDEIVAIINGDGIAQYTRLSPIAHTPPMRLQHPRFWTTRKES